MALPMPTEREAARKMWLAGLSRAVIARALHVKPNTVSHWRWSDQWPPRKAYSTRQIPRSRIRKRPRDVGRFERERPLYACPHCGTRASEATGHPSCQPVAA